MAKAKPSSIPLFSILLACAGGILIGLSPIFVRASELGPMTTGFYRMLIAIPLMWGWMMWETKAKSSEQKAVEKLTKKDHFVLALAGTFFALDVCLWNWSVDHTAIVNAALFNNTAAFFVPLLMWLLFSEKQSTRLVITTIYGFLGCVLLAAESFTISLDQLVGDFVSLMSGLMVTFYVITIKKIRDRLTTGVLMFWTGISSLIGMGLFAVLFGESFWPVSAGDWLNVAGQAILVHVMGQGLIAYAMGQIPASYGGLIMLLCPVTSALFGWIIYEEALSAIKIVGIMVILSSIIFVQQIQQKKAEEVA